MQASPTTAEANRAVAFINGLTHAKGSRYARKPFNLTNWQEHQIVRPLFGRLRADGTRQYRKALLALGRKNGKSEIGAAVALYMLISEPEQGGEIYSAATDREQASLVFNVAAQMVKNDAELSRLCKITESRRQIIYTPTNSIYRAIPADAPHAHGYNASGLIYDELHAAPNSELWEVLTTSMGARTQPLTLAITTAGHDRETVCYQIWDYARKVRDGIVDDPSFLPILFETPDDADWKDEEIWKLANPALGDFRSLEEMRELFREAQAIPARENTFRQLYLNQWTESVSRWFSDDAWKACAETYDASDLAGRDCYAGLDLAYRSDYAALVLLFPFDGEYRLLPLFFLPEDGTRNTKALPAADFIREGVVELTPGNSTDFGVIRKRLNEAQKRFNIKKIAVDPWNARQLTGELMADGFEVVDFAQTMRNFSEPTKTFEALVNGKKMHHNGNRLLRWCFQNVALEHDTSGNYRPSKKKSSEKIDGAVAAVMALAIETMPDPEADLSYYETHKVEFI